MIFPDTCHTDTVNTLLVVSWNQVWKWLHTRSQTFSNWLSFKGYWTKNLFLYRARFVASTVLYASVLILHQLCSCKIEIAIFVSILKISSTYVETNLTPILKKSTKKSIQIWNHQCQFRRSCFANSMPMFALILVSYQSMYASIQYEVNSFTKNVATILNFLFPPSVQCAS